MKERIRICCPQDCVTLLRRYSRMRQEHFGVVFLNNQREVIQSKCFFVGSDNICHVHSKIVWWKACKLEATSMILFHNHPSGDTSPSDYDINLTETFEKGGALLGIQVLDHIIIGKYNYYSFLEHEKMSKEETQTKAAEQ